MDRIPLCKPDVAILDVRLEVGSGIEVCRDARSLMPELACLMLTSFADDEALFASVMAGAAGYILKQVKARDLLDDVHRVAAGESLLDPKTVARVVERISNPPKTDPEFQALTPQERTDSRPHRGGADQPTDCRFHVPCRAHGEELHHRPLAQTQDVESYGGSDLRHQTQGRKGHSTEPDALVLCLVPRRGDNVDADRHQLTLEPRPLLVRGTNNARSWRRSRMLRRP